MILIIKKYYLLLIFDLWWLGFIVLSDTGFNQFQILNIVTFISLALVPGALTLLILQLKGLEPWGYISLSVALSLLELMVIGLVGNTLLPLIGISRPLDSSYLMGEITLLVVALVLILLTRIEHLGVLVYRYVFFETLRDMLFAGGPIVFVFLSIFGAIHLNDGGGDTVTLILLAAMALYLVALFRNATTLNENVIPSALFFTALSLLFMTSLRGWYVTGHDIQQEYKVFELTKNAGLWSIANYRDAYNACLSITILPTIFSNLLKVADPYVYKFFFQMFFALCASIMYLISRNWLDRKMSLLAGLYFIAFPTFFEDMPFLNRQEIAFLFYGLMIYIIFKLNLRPQIQRVLFLLLGIGVILSHYSTTYTVLVIFALSAITMPLFGWLLNRYRGTALLHNSALNTRSLHPIKINLGIVALLVALSFVWTGLITDTGGNVTKVITETLQAVGSGFAENSRSLDAVSLLTFGKPSQTQEIGDYLKNVVAPARFAATAGDYFDAQTYSSYSFTPVGDEQLPLTSLGRFVAQFHINVSYVVTFVGQLLEKLMEVIVLLGVVYVLVRKKILKHIDNEYYLLAVYCLFFIACNIVLPVLSTEYGVFRALQQSMFILSPFIVVGTIVVGTYVMKLLTPLYELIMGNRKNFPPHYGHTTIPLTIAILFFLYSTAFIPQLFGGNVPQLHLNNTGSYYDNYLTQEGEVYGIEWLNSTLNAYVRVYGESQPALQADKFSQNKIAALTNLGFSGDIFPQLIRKDAYVFLSASNVLNKKSNLIYNNDAITYVYPIQFLDDNKNLVYNNGEVRVYR